MNLPTQLIFMLCINIMLVVGGVFDEKQLYDPNLKSQAKQQGNFLPQFFDFTNSSTGRPEVRDFSENFTSETKDISSAGGVQTGAFQGFTDQIRMVRSFFGFLLDVVTAPFQLLQNPNLGLPWEFRMMIGLPFSILYILALIRWIRTGE